MRLRLFLAGLVLAATVALVPAISAGAGEFELGSPDSEPVPNRTVSFQGSTHVVDSLIQTGPGAETEVTVSAPDEAYRVYVYDSDEQIVDSKRGNGDGTFTFDLTGYEPGSYTIALSHDGDYAAILPVVVQGYAVSIDAPDHLGRSESASIELTVTSTAADAEPAAVRVILASGAERLVVDANGSNGQYRASVRGSDLEAGSYTVYGIAQANASAFGRNELMGVSPRVSLAVTGATGAESTPAASVTNASPEPARAGTPDPDRTTAAEIAVNGPDGSETPVNAITPGELNESTTAGDGDGFTGFTVAVALSCFGAPLVRRLRASG